MGASVLLHYHEHHHHHLPPHHQNYHILQADLISLFRGGDGGLGPTSAGGDAARGSGPVSRL